MKTISNRHFFLAFMVSILALYTANSQSVDWLMNYASEINTGTDIMKQSFEEVQGKTCAVLFKTEKTDKKGNTVIEKSEFYLSDMDENTVRFKVAGKVVNVEMNTRGNQKFIKKIVENEIKEYSSELILVQDNPDKARELVDALKKNIPLCKRQEHQWKDPSSALAWIASNLGTFSASDIEYQQSFTYGKTGENLAEFMLNQKDAKGIITSFTYFLNLTDIDPAGVKLNVAGKNLSVELPVREDKKYIKNLKNNELLNYASSFEVRANDIDLAREILGAFKYVVPLLKSQEFSFQNVQDALTWVSNSLGEVSQGTYQYKQKMESAAEKTGPCLFTSLRTDAKGVELKELFIFYLADLDEPAVDIKVSGKSISVNVVSKKKSKFIQAYKSDVQQNYTDNFEILTDDIEKAKAIQVALKAAISKADEGIIQWTDKQKALDWVSGQIADVTDGESKKVQKFSYDPSKDYNAVLAVNTINNSAEIQENFSFYLNDVDPASVETAVSGKKLSVGLSTGKQKLIKYEKSGLLQNYSADIEIAVNDVLLAKNIASALKYAIPLCKPTVLTWKDINEILEWLNQQISQVSNGTVSINQKIELLEGEKCKIKLTSSSADSKGVITEFIYEVNMADIEPKTIEFDVSGKEIAVALNCKGKQKLIKPYKNGEVQNFIAQMQIVADDVMKARSVQEAFRSLIEKCTK